MQITLTGTCKNSITQTSRCVQHFCVSKQWYGCQCLGFLTSAQMLMHVIAHMGYMDILRECALKFTLGEKSLATKGVKPV